MGLSFVTGSGLKVTEERLLSWRLRKESGSVGCLNWETSRSSSRASRKCPISGSGGSNRPWNNAEY